MASYQLHKMCYVTGVKERGLQALSDALRRTPGRERLSAALCGVISPIVEYDSRTRSDLTDTLRAYLEHGGNLASTADHLFLHRNSVLYRLQRIEDLCGLNVRDRRTRLLLLVAWALVDPRLLGVRPDEPLMEGGDESQRS